MKAVLLRQFGGPEVLRLEDVDVPSVGPGEVLVKVHSVSVNRTLDLAVRTGNYPVKIRVPHVLGADPAGTIADIGDGVEGFAIGDRVAVVSFIACRQCRRCRQGDEASCLASQHIGLHRWGGYAEYVAVPARSVFKLPDNVSFAEGTVITRHFPMAFNQIIHKAGVQPDEWVVVMGATGALGTCCVQVAKMVGARVIAAAGADDRVAASLRQGADYGINYRRQDLAAEVMRLTAGQGADVVCENIADPTLWPSAFNSLAVGGRLITAGAHGGGTVTLDVKTLYLRRLRIIGTAGTNFSDVERALAAAAAGKIRALIDRRMTLDDAAVAHRMLEQRQITGKIILEPIHARFGFMQQLEY